MTQGFWQKISEWWEDTTYPLWQWWDDQMARREAKRQDRDEFWFRVRLYKAYASPGESWAAFNAKQDEIEREQREARIKPEYVQAVFSALCQRFPQVRWEQKEALGVEDEKHEKDTRFTGFMLVNGQKYGMWLWASSLLPKTVPLENAPVDLVVEEAVRSVQEKLDKVPPATEEPAATAWLATVKP